MASASSGGGSPSPSSVTPSDYDLFYNKFTEVAYTAYQMRALFGINLQTIDIEVLNYQGFYPVVETSPTADPALYTSTPVYTVNGEVADETWLATPLPLPTAKANGTVEVQTTANTEVANIITASGYSAEVLAAAGAELEGGRPAVYQTVIAAEQVITDQLALDVVAIAAATTVDEINNIVNPPTGILSTGRGAGAGPLDLNLSYYTEFNSVSLTEAETELYIPATSTVLTYGEYTPNAFDSAGNCFTTGNYLVQIREVATGMVISEFECPLAVEHNEDVAF